MTKNEVISLVNKSLENLDVYRVLLFGSYAAGNQTEGSDIDLLVVTNDEFVFNSFAQKMEVKLKISRALKPLREKADIDLIVQTKPMFRKFLELNSTFKQEILQSASIIYERNN
jgi:predicted nucleotidyltransferase